MINQFFIECRCGSSLNFVECCLKLKEGKTPETVKIKILEAIINTFYYFGERRGELCLYSSKFVQDILKVFHGMESYIILGKAMWDNFPDYFDWKNYENKYQEYHAWILTEYGEIVDLTCDALDQRTDSGYLKSTKLGIAPPERCWEKIETLNDRSYIGKQVGIGEITFDYQKYQIPRNVCLNIYNNSLK